MVHRLEMKRNISLMLKKVDYRVPGDTSKQPRNQSS